MPKTRLRNRLKQWKEWHCHLKAKTQVKSSLVFGIVQEKMKKSLDSGDKGNKVFWSINNEPQYFSLPAWLNDPFMDKIQNNPKLAKAFLDPGTNV